MIEAFLGILGGAFLGIYILSIVIYLKELLGDIRRFKPRYFFEYVIILVMTIGSLIPILNSIAAIRSITFNNKNK